MGKPATDWFCKNGHHVSQSSHHEFCQFDMFEEDFRGDLDNPDEEAFNAQFVCPFCGIKGRNNFADIIEWDDEEYGDIDEVVPHTPVKYEDTPRVDHHGNKYFVKIAVYDVERLFKHED